MNAPRPSFRQRALAAALAVALTASPAVAAPPPWQDAAFSYYAENKPLDAVLREFASAFSLSTDLPAGLQGTVNGKFTYRSPTEFIDRLGSGLDDVYEPLVRTGFKLLHRLLVDMGRPVDRKLLNAGRERNWSGDAGPGALGGFHDVLGRLIDDPIVETLKLDTNSLAFHGEKERGSGTGWSLGGRLDDFGEK